MKNKNNFHINSIIIIILFIINVTFNIVIFYSFKEKIKTINIKLANKEEIKKINLNKIKEKNLLILSLQNILYANMILQTSADYSKTSQLLNESMQLLSTVNNIKYSNLVKNIEDYKNKMQQKNTFNMQEVLNQIDSVENTTVSWLTQHPALPNIPDATQIEIPQSSQYEWAHKLIDMLNKKITIKQYSNKSKKNIFINNLYNIDNTHYLCQRIKWSLLEQDNIEWTNAIKQLMYFIKQPVFSEDPHYEENLATLNKLHNIDRSKTIISLAPLINSMFHLLKN